MATNPRVRIPRLERGKGQYRLKQQSGLGSGLAHQRNCGSIRKPRMSWNVPGANSPTLHKRHQRPQHRPLPRNGFSRLTVL